MMEELLKQFIDQMNTRFEQMEARFDQIDALFDKVDADIKSLKDEVSELTNKVDNSLIENHSSFTSLAISLDEQHSIFRVVEELKKVKIDIEYLCSRTGIHDMKINNLNKRIQS